MNQNEIQLPPFNKDIVIPNLTETDLEYLQEKREELFRMFPNLDLTGFFTLNPKLYQELRCFARRHHVTKSQVYAFCGFGYKNKRIASPEEIKKSVDKKIEEFGIRLHAIYGTNVVVTNLHDLDPWLDKDIKNFCDYHAITREEIYKRTGMKIKDEDFKYKKALSAFKKKLQEIAVDGNKLVSLRTNYPSLHVYSYHLAKRFNTTPSEIFKELGFEELTIYEYNKLHADENRAKLEKSFYNELIAYYPDKFVYSITIKYPNLYNQIQSFCKNFDLKFEQFLNQLGFRTMQSTSLEEKIIFKYKPLLDDLYGEGQHAIDLSRKDRTLFNKLFQAAKRNGITIEDLCLICGHMYVLSRDYKEKPYKQKNPPRREPTEEELRAARAKDPLFKDVLNCYSNDDAERQ